MAELATDYSGFVGEADNGRRRLRLAVEGINCAGCAIKIEKALNANDGVEARVNVTRRQLTLVWNGDKARGNDLLGLAERLGFRFSPVVEKDAEASAREERFLLKCMAVAGFAMGNLMIFSLALWFSHDGDMGEATRGLFHWICALIALPAILYAGRPFFGSAWAALRNGRTNMDVPISVGVLLATGMSLYETATQGGHVYFDSAIMLLFLLLAGRYLDRQARGRARAAAENVLSLNSGTATIEEDAKQRRIPSADIRRGMTLLAARGERIFADGEVVAGEAEADTSALTGETLPRWLRAGDAALAGMVNLGNPLKIKVMRTPEESLAGEIVRLMEKAEQGNAAYVRLADKVAGYYTPVVHLLALAAFAFWWGLMGMAWQPALMIAVTVLIITCPCALGLAVPVAQVLASQWLFRRGILVKSADALERIAKTDTVIFDKTGTLTTGEMEAKADAGSEDLQLAASLAAQSGHPLSWALVKSWDGDLLQLENVTETPGGGVMALWHGEKALLGSRAFCGVEERPEDGAQETWLKRGNRPPVRFVFHDRLRDDAARAVASLKESGLRVTMLSGDRARAAAKVAQELGMDEYHAVVMCS